MSTIPTSSAAVARPQRAEAWTGPAVRLLVATAFQLGGRVRLVAALAGAIGVALGLFALSLPPAMTFVVLAVATAMVIAWRLTGRWAWPWQRAHVWMRWHQKESLGGILSRRLDRAAAEAWLAGSPDAPVHDRRLVLAWLGREAEAEDLIASLPATTPKDRFEHAWHAAGQRWRAAGVLDVTTVVAILPELDDSDRLHAAVVIDYWSGVAAVADGRDLHSVPPPVAPGLPFAEAVGLWRRRLWPVEWLVGAFLATWVTLFLASRLAAV